MGIEPGGYVVAGGSVAGSLPASPPPRAVYAQPGVVASPAPAVVVASSPLAGLSPPHLFNVHAPKHQALALRDATLRPMEMVMMAQTSNTEVKLEALCNLVVLLEAERGRPGPLPFDVVEVAEAMITSLIDVSALKMDNPDIAVAVAMSFGLVLETLLFQIATGGMPDIDVALRGRLLDAARSLAALHCFLDPHLHFHIDFCIEGAIRLNEEDDAAFRSMSLFAQLSPQTLRSSDGAMFDLIDQIKEIVFGASSKRGWFDGVLLLKRLGLAALRDKTALQELQDLYANPNMALADWKLLFAAVETMTDVALQTTVPEICRIAFEGEALSDGTRRPGIVDFDLDGSLGISTQTQSSWRVQWKVIESVCKIWEQKDDDIQDNAATLRVDRPEIIEDGAQIYSMLRRARQLRNDWRATPRPRLAQLEQQRTHLLAEDMMLADEELRITRQRDGSGRGQWLDGAALQDLDTQIAHIRDHRASVQHDLAEILRALEPEWASVDALWKRFRQEWDILHQDAADAFRRFSKHHHTSAAGHSDLWTVYISHLLYTTAAPPPPAPVARPPEPEPMPMPEPERAYSFRETADSFVERGAYNLSSYAELPSRRHSAASIRELDPPVDDWGDFEPVYSRPSSISRSRAPSYRAPSYRAPSYRASSYRALGDPVPAYPRTTSYRPRRASLGVSAAPPPSTSKTSYRRYSYAPPTTRRGSIYLGPGAAADPYNDPGADLAPTRATLESLIVAACDFDSRAHARLKRTIRTAAPGDVESVAASFDAAARDGDVQGQCVAGFCYLKGFGFPYDPVSAFRLLSEAAEAGDAVAQCHLGAMLLEGKGAAKDNDAAYHWFSQAAHQNLPRGHACVGWCLENGLGVGKDVPKATEFYDYAVSHNDARGLVNMGWLRGSQGQYVEAADLYRSAADLEDPRGLTNYGYCLETACGVQQDYDGAFDCYLKAALQGDAIGQTNLAFMYASIYQDMEKAVYYWTLAAEQGQAVACNNLYLAYSRGDGAPHDPERAQYYANLAGQASRPEIEPVAQTRAAPSPVKRSPSPKRSVPPSGAGLPAFMVGKPPADADEAIRRFREQANAGDPEGMVALGWCYEYGYGTHINYEESVRLYKNASDLKYAPGQLCLGYMYEKGLGVPRNYRQAQKYYDRAVLQGNARAMAHLGFLYQHGMGVGRDVPRAVGLYRESSKLNDPFGHVQLGRALEDAVGVEKQPDQALALYKRAADQEYPPGQTALALCYLNGTCGVSRDNHKAVALLEKASRASDPGGMTNLAYCYSQGRGVEKDYYRAFQLFKRASETNYAIAIANVGICHKHGLGTDKNMEMALHCFRRAAEMNEPVGLINLGVCLRNGEGVHKDVPKAAEYFKIAADRNDPVGQVQLGICYYQGEGMPHDYDRAFDLFCKSAESGNAIAMYMKGSAYEHGRGTSRSPDSAVRCYTAAADAGETRARSALGWMYMSGDGVPKDYTRARELCESAAQDGDASALNNLAFLVSNGLGGAQRDPERAFQLFKEAGTRGHPRAALNTAMMYKRGEGCVADPAQAFEWTKRAARGGYPPALAALGIYYKKGQYVRKDLAQAVSHFQSAAAKNDPVGLANLGEMYATGEGGLPRDVAKAIRYLSHAAELGHARARVARDRLRDQHGM